MNTPTATNTPAARTRTSRRPVPRTRRPGTGRPRTRRRTAIGAATAVVVLLTACSGGGSSSGASSPPTPPPTTSLADDATVDATPTTTAPADAEPSTELLDALLETRDEAGRMPLDSALTAFAARYGGLPGVETPSLAADAIEATTAARWLSAHRDELTDEQRAAVDAAMSPLDVDGTPVLAVDQAPASSSGLRARPSPESGVRATLPPGVDLDDQSGCFGGDFPFADAPGAGKYRDLVRLALAEVSLLMGPLDIPVYTAFSEFEGVNADLNPWAPDCSGPAQACQIRLAPLALQMNDSTLVKTLAHELVHCYQSRAVGATSIAALPDWLVEGFPSYVAETVGVSIGATAPNYWWDKWFKRASVPLYTRTYDALGFYVVVKQAGGDPFGTYITALTTKNSSAAFNVLIGGVQDHFASIWGATHFRQIDRGMFWELDGPGATLYKPAIGVSTITNGGGYASSISEAQAEPDRFALHAEVVIVQLQGPVKGRYSFKGGPEEVIADRVEWCTLGYPCVCPDDTQRGGTLVEQALEDEVAVGVAGLANGGVLDVKGMTFEDYCGPKRPQPTEPPAPPAVDECLIGSWVSDSWTIPGPPGLGLSLSGGSGISMMIDREGLVTTDFAAMAPLTGAYTFSQSGSATQEITAAGGSVDERSTNQQMNVGPGVFAVWNDTTRYTCGDGSFTLIAFDEVEGVDIPITFRRAG